MLSKLLINYEETASVILFCIGFSTMLLNKNLIKKIIGMDIMDTAVYLFLASQGYIKGRTVPIVVDGIQSVEAYINPIPAGLVLTGIVVSVSVSALMLALSIRLYYRYNTLNLDEIIALSGKEAVRSELPLLQHPADADGRGRQLGDERQARAAHDAVSDCGGSGLHRRRDDLHPADGRQLRLQDGPLPRAVGQ